MVLMVQREEWGRRGVEKVLSSWMEEVFKVLHPLTCFEAVTFLVMGHLSCPVSSTLKPGTPSLCCSHCNRAHLATALGSFSFTSFWWVSPYLWSPRQRVKIEIYFNNCWELSCLRALRLETSGGAAVTEVFRRNLLSQLLLRMALGGGNTNSPLSSSVTLQLFWFLRF